MAESEPKSNDAIPVSGYQRSDGTKVSEHQRTLPKRENNDKQDDEEERKDDNPKETKKQARSMTAQELLDLDMKERQQRLVDMAVAQDAEKATLVAMDEAARVAKEQEESGQIAEHAVPEQTEPGKIDLLRSLEDALLNEHKGEDHKIERIILNVRAGKYDDQGGDLGKNALFYHLQDAALYKLAKGTWAF